MVASVVANCHRDQKKRRRPFEPKDFLPPALLQGPRARQEKQDPARQALATAVALGAPPEILAQIRQAQARHLKPKKEKR